MIDIENYKAAVAWHRRNVTALQSEPENPTLQYALLQSFEVTHNISEAILRQAYVSLGSDEFAPYVSIRELIWRAGEEGFILSNRKDWLQYGLALETMREAFSLSASESIVDAVQLLSHFADEMEHFTLCLERRLVNHG